MSLSSDVFTDLLGKYMAQCLGKPTELSLYLEIYLEMK